MMSPMVSIGLPVFNGEDYLSEALDSILSQAFYDFELIISDNCSSDATELLCLNYAEKDKRIKFFKQDKNMGAAWNYNYVFAQACGKYFRWASHDDLVSPDSLHKCVNVLETDSNVILAYPKTVFIDERGEKMSDYEDNLDLNYTSPSRRFRAFHERFKKLDRCNPIFGLIRSDVLRQTPLIGSYHSSDYVLLGKLSLMGKFKEIKDAYFFRRIHPNISTVAFAGVKERYEWFDPTFSKKLVFPYWKFFFSHMNSIRTSNLSISEKIKCKLILIRWCVNFYPWLKGDIKRAVKQVIAFRSRSDR